MSYIVFGQTSDANGTRDKWFGTPPNAGQTAGTTAGVVNAIDTTVAASAFSEAAIVAAGGYDNLGGKTAAQAYADTGALIDKGNKAIFDLSSALGKAAFQSAASAAGQGNVLGVGAANTVAGSANDRTLTDTTRDGTATGITGKTLAVALADTSWNDIKNVEIRIGSADTGSVFDRLVVENFVDGRIKIGDSSLHCVPAKTALAANERFAIELTNAKRGEIDASQSDMAVDVTLAVWTNNAGWQNSFTNTGSAFGDTFTIDAGALYVKKGVSEFAGSGTRTDTDGSINDGDYTDTNQGQLTTLYTNLGAGDDRYDARGEAGLLATRDYVWGGSGDDVILGGGGNDVLFGDFGTAADIGVTVAADPVTMTLKLGGTGNPALWVDGTGASIQFREGQTNLWQTFNGSNAHIATLDPTKYLGDRGVLITDAWDGPTAVFDAATKPDAYGLGVDTTSDFYSAGNSANNPEINAGRPNVANSWNAVSDGMGGWILPASNELRVGLGADATAAKLQLSAFYGDEPIGNQGMVVSEGAVIRLFKDGAEVGFAIVAAKEQGAQPGVIFATEGLSVSVDALAGISSGTYAANNAGRVDVQVAIEGGFDTVQVASAGDWQFVNGAWTPAAVPSADVADFLLAGICYTPAASYDDVIDGGAGNDRIEGGLDSGSIAYVETEALFVGYQGIVADLDQVDEAGEFVTGAVPAGSGIALTWLGYSDTDANSGDNGVFGIMNRSGATGDWKLTSNKGHVIDLPELADQEGVIVNVGALDPATVGNIVWSVRDDATNAVVKGTATVSTGNVKSAVGGSIAVAIEAVHGDDLTGGTGNDTFVWNAGDGVDLIRDLGVGADRLVFDTADGLAGLLREIDYLGQTSVLVTDGADSAEGVILLGRSVASIGAGEIVWA